MDIELVFYFALGALFAFIANRIARHGRWSQIALITAVTVAILLVSGALLENQARPSERAIGFPILLALLSPTIAAALVWLAAATRQPPFLRWTLGTLGWASGFFITIIAALALNWVTF